MIKFRVLMLALLATFITSCGPTNQPSESLPSEEDSVPPTSEVEPSVDGSSVEVSEDDPSVAPSEEESVAPDESGWTIEQEKTMSDNFYGYVLPYPECDSLTVTFEYNESVSTVYVTCNVGEGGVQAYYEKVAALGEHYLYASYEQDGYYYVSFSADVYADVDIVFYAINEEGTQFLDSGVLNIEMSIYQYYASWPEEQISSIFEGVVSESIPGYQEGYLYDLGDYYEDYGYVIVYAYTEQSEAEAIASYEKELADAGYTYYYDSDYSCYIATSSGNEIMIAYFYDSEYGMLEVDIAPLSA